MGRGWKIAGLSRIERKSADHGVPEFSTSDVYLVDGVQLHTDGSGSLPGCSMRLEQDDNRCFEYDNSENLWTARRDGWTWTFGEPDGATTWGVCATEHTDETWDSACMDYLGLGAPETSTAWLLSQIEDPHGNVVSFNYRVPIDPPSRGWTVLEELYAFTHLIDTVSWASDTLALEFEYEARPDERASARSGMVRLLTKRLHAIQLVAGSTDDVRYQLTWLDEATDPCQPGGTVEEAIDGQSTLQRIEQVGALRNRTLRCMETNQDATSFDTTIDMDTGEGGIDPGIEWPTDGAYDQVWAAPAPRVVNFDGDAWPDLAVLLTRCVLEDSFCYTEHYAWTNSADGSGELVEDAALTDFLNEAIDGETLTDTNSVEVDFAILDLDGDGRDDILTVDGDGNDTLWTWDPVTETGSSTTGAVSLDIGQLRSGQIVDINGDGLLDLLVPPYHDAEFDNPYARWIPNQGPPLYWDDSASVTLTLPTDSGSESYAEIEALIDACEAEGGQGYPTGEVNPDREVVSFADWFDATVPGLWEERYLARQSRWADANGDGITDLIVSLHTCWDPDNSPEVAHYDDDPNWLYSRIFYGDGSGQFFDSGLPGGAPFSTERVSYLTGDSPGTELPSDFDVETYWKERLDVEVAEQVWSTTENWALIDLDRSGRPQLVNAYQDGECGFGRLGATPDMGLADGFGVEFPTTGAWSDWWTYWGDCDLYPVTGSGILTEAGSDALVELPWHAFADAYPSAHFMLPADWNGDGFIDMLRIRRPEHNYTTEGGGTISGTLDIEFQAGLFLNERTVAPGRIEAITGEWGGRSEIGYGFTATDGGSPDLPFSAEVVTWTQDVDGFTERWFSGGQYADGKFLGFRDALVRRENGRLELSRFGMDEPLNGFLAYHAAWRADGSLETLRVFDPVSETDSVDTTAPYFNPVRRQCEFWLGPGMSGSTPPEQSEDIQSLIDDCRDEGGGIDASAVDMWDDMGWGVELAWAPTLPSPDPPAFSPLEVTPPAALVVPATPAFDQLYGGLITTVRTYFREFAYDHQRLVQTYDRRDTSTLADDIVTTLTLDTWDTTAMGSQVLTEVISRPTGSPLLTRTRSSFADFDTPETVTESAGLSSRTWNYTWDRGRVATLEDPLSNTSSWVWNDCGAHTSFTDGETRTETLEYDDACRLTDWTFQGSTTTIEYDEFGRMVSRSLDPGVGDFTTTAWAYDDDLSVIDDRSTGSEPRIGIDHGDGSIELVYLDPWGRTFRQTTCSGPTSTTSGSTTSVASAGMYCYGSAGDPYQSRDWYYASDGSLRAETAPFGKAELDALNGGGGSANTIASTWTYVDEFGRPRVELAPAPIPLGGGFSPSWVTTDLEYLPGSTTLVDPVGVDCTVDYSTISVSRSCYGISRGSTLYDAMGRTKVETDPSGVSMITTYDDFGRPLSRFLDRSITYAMGTFVPQWVTHWDPLDRLVEQIDPVGNSWQWDYDGVNRPILLEHLDAASSTPITLNEWVYYDGAAPEVEVTDINLNTWTRRLDGFGRVWEEERPDGSTIEQEWDSHGGLARLVDVDGVESYWSRDALGNPISKTVTGATGTYSWDWTDDGHLLSTEDEDGVETTYQWAFDGRMMSMRRPRVSGAPWLLASWEYDARGQVEIQYEDGVKSKWEWDVLGRPIKARHGWDDSGGGTSLLDEEWSWTDSDRLETTKLGGHETSYDFNEVGWLESVVHPGSGAPTEYWDYDKAGHVVGYQDESMVYSEWVVDGLGRTTDELLPGEDWRTFEYDHGVSAASVSSLLSGMLEQVVRYEPDGGVWEDSYDFAGRLVRSKLADARAVEQDFDGSRLVQRRHYDSSGVLSARESWSYDGRGRLEQHWGPVEDATWLAQSGVPYAGDWVQDYDWTDAGRLLSLAGPNDLTTWEWTDGVVTSEDIDGVTERFHTYDAAYPRRITTTETGRTTTRAVNRGMYLISEVTTESGGDTLRKEFADYDAYGTARTVRTKLNGTTETLYDIETDARGRVTDVDATVDGGLVGSLAYDWYDNGDVYTIEMSWAGGGYVGVEYDRYAGVLDEVRDLSTGNPVAEFTARDLLGRPEQIDLNGGVSGIDTNWDTMGRIDHQAITSGSSTVDTRTWQFDGRGRVWERTMNNASTSFVDVSSTYAYDEPGWLVEEVRDSGTASERTLVFDYDAGGNRVLTEEFDASSSLVSSVSYGYDFGNLLKDRTESSSTTDYHWDTHGGLAGDDWEELDFLHYPDGKVSEVQDSVTHAPVTTVFRDAFGMPVKLTNALASNRTQLWGNPEGSWPIVSLESGGEKVMWVAAEGMLVGKIEDGTIVPLSTDPQGSLVLADTEILGAHGAFGDDVDRPTSTGARHVYAGIEDMPGLGSYSIAGHRLYNSDTGRFASLDPMGLAGGTNRFMYVYNDPMDFVDPSGLLPTPSVGGTISSLGGALGGGGSCGSGCVASGGADWGTNAVMERLPAAPLMVVGMAKRELDEFGKELERGRIVWNGDGAGAAEDAEDKSDSGNSPESDEEEDDDDEGDSNAWPGDIRGPSRASEFGERGGVTVAKSDPPNNGGHGGRRGRFNWIRTVGSWFSSRSLGGKGGKGTVRDGERDGPVGDRRSEAHAELTARNLRIYDRGYDPTTGDKHVEFTFDVPPGANPRDYVLVQLVRGDRYTLNTDDQGQVFKSHPMGLNHIGDPVRGPFLDYVIDRGDDYDPVYWSTKDSRWNYRQVGPNTYFAYDTPQTIPPEELHGSIGVTDFEFQMGLYRVSDVPRTVSGAEDLPPALEAREWESKTYWEYGKTPIHEIPESLDLPKSSDP